MCGVVGWVGILYLFAGVSVGERVPTSAQALVNLEPGKDCLYKQAGGSQTRVFKESLWSLIEQASN